ncbi:MAG: hypothetical protein AAGF11_41785 [Myxococcota bacterium]
MDAAEAGTGDPRMLDADTDWAQLSRALWDPRRCIAVVLAAGQRGGLRRRQHLPRFVHQVNPRYG